MPVVIVRIAAPYPAEGPLTQRESGFGETLPAAILNSKALTGVGSS